MPYPEVIRLGVALGFKIRPASSSYPQSEADAIRRRVASQRQRPRVPDALPRVPAQASSPSKPTGTASRSGSARCSCCSLPLDRRSLEVSASASTRCLKCSDHFEMLGESDERKLARYTEHEARLKRGWEVASEAATSAERRMKHALRSRDVWKATLVRLVLEHEQDPEGKCRCGAARSPCFTIQKLEGLNLGIARTIERLATLSEDDLVEELRELD